MLQLIDRQSIELAERLRKAYPVIFITGPRQSGKSTLARMAFPRKKYVSLEDIDQASMAKSDTKGFLSGFPDGCIIDEVQRVPEILNYLQGIVDNDKRTGLFVLTGSNQHSIHDGISQSLAGRTGNITLLPFSCHELKSASILSRTPEEAIFKGGYPPIYSRHADCRLWLSDYIMTYLERDVRQIINLKNLDSFQRFLGLCAGSIGQTVDYVKLGGVCGVSHTTAREWLNILEASHVVYRLKPYFSNIKKRLIKTPKLYFGDTGLACRLLGISSPSQLKTHYAYGFLFENLVLLELLKWNYNTRSDWNFSFFRTYDGLEVDIIIEHDGHLDAVECKAGTTLSTDWLCSLDKWMENTPGKVIGKLNLVYGGNDESSLSGKRIMSWRNISENLSGS